MENLFYSKVCTEMVLWVFFLCSHSFVQKKREWNLIWKATLVTKLLPFILKVGTTVKAILCWMLKDYTVLNTETWSHILMTNMN